MIVPFYCQQNGPDIHSLFVWPARGERKVRGHLALRQGSFAPCTPIYEWISEWSPNFALWIMC